MVDWYGTTCGRGHHHRRGWDILHPNAYLISRTNGGSPVDGSNCGEASNCWLGASNVKEHYRTNHKPTSDVLTSLLGQATNRQ